jgi:hypothetical protein
VTIKAESNFRFDVHDITLKDHDEQNMKDVAIPEAFTSGEEEEEEKEHMETGHISTTVYYAYVKHIGFTLTTLILVTTFVMQLSANGLSVWYSYWVSHKSQFTSSQFIEITSFIILINVIFAGLRSIFFARLKTESNIILALCRFMLLILMKRRVGGSSWII